MAPLTTRQRKALSKSSFVFPSKAPGPGSYPINDRRRAANALARVKQHGTPSQQATVRAAVCKRYPSMPSCKRR